MILAGDIGGTNSRLAFFDTHGYKLHLVLQNDFPSRERHGLNEIVREFVKAEGQPVDCAAFGIAGPVRRGQCVAANLPWVVEAAALAADLKLPSVALINDLEAFAWGISELDESEFATLNPGAPDADGNAAVIAAGTGLGEAGLYWDGARLRPFAAEGGHADFAPADELQLDLLAYLRKKFHHVSCERVLSGPGLKNIYEFLRDSGRAEEPAWLRDQLRESADPSAVIAQAGLDHKAPICEQALDVCAAVYGAEAGNLALRMMATGGLYLGGGIAPKLRRKLEEPVFMKAFLDKGRMRPLLESVPVRIILNPKAGLLGAARCALVHVAFGDGTQQATVGRTRDA